MRGKAWFFNLKVLDQVVGNLPNMKSNEVWGLYRSAVSEQRKGKTMGLRGRHLGEELETLGEEDHAGGAGTRIMVYVRLRPMSKKEKEAGAQTCVRVDNKRDIYLTEFANENDYLRLKRLKGRHFAFDAAFPDTTAQQEVYSTRCVWILPTFVFHQIWTIFEHDDHSRLFGDHHQHSQSKLSPSMSNISLRHLEHDGHS